MMPFDSVARRLAAAAPKIKPWYSQNANEQCKECKGRIKLRPCMICGGLFCAGCYSQRFSFGYAVCICVSCLPSFSYHTGKGGPLPKQRRDWANKDWL